MNICDNRLDIRSHINDDDTSPLRVVIDSVWPTAAENELDDRGSRPQKKKNGFRGPTKRGQKMAPRRGVFGLRFHFRCGRKMATLFVLGKRKKKQKKIMTRLPAYH